MISDGVLPGPGGKGGIPTGARPRVVLAKPGPDGFYVELAKPSEPVSLDGMKYSLTGNKIGSNFVSTITSAGWDLTYDTPRGDGSTSVTHIIYVDIGGGHYECTYDEGNGGSAAAAEGICRSLRPKTGK
jgi:hypothetical protein